MVGAQQEARDRTLATLRTDIPVFADVDELRWTGPRDGFDALAARLEGRN